MSVLPDPVKLCQKLIHIPSITPDTDTRCADRLREVLEPAFKCESIPVTLPTGEVVQNLLAVYGNGQAPHFCFGGHTDVVSVGEERKWTSGPFAAEERDGHIYGRGAVDMKSSVACSALAAARFVDKVGADFPGTISLVIAGDEESTGLGMWALMKTLEEKYSAPDCCVVGEPSSLETFGDSIKSGRRGNMHADLTVQGKLGHTAYPDRAVNAAHLLSEMIYRITSEPMDNGNDEFQPSTLAISKMEVDSGGRNVIPDVAYARINIRFNTEHTFASVRAWLEDRFRQVSDSFKVDYIEDKMPFVVEEGKGKVGLVELVADSVEEVIGVRPTPNTIGGTSDAAVIYEWCPVVEFGPVGKTMHMVDENISIGEIHNLVDIYERMLINFFNKYE